MRPILPPDVDLWARVVLRVPRVDRVGAVRQTLDHADIADRWRKRLGRAHPEFGDGSVLWLLSRSDPVQQRFCDAEYCEALAVVAGAIQDWRKGRASLCRTHRPA